MPKGSTNLDLLRRTGEVVFGEYWQTPMATHIKVDKRTINRWKQEEWPVPDVIPDGRPLEQVLQELLHKHEKDIARLKTMLAKKTPDGE